MKSDLFEGQKPLEKKDGMLDEVKASIKSLIKNEKIASDYSRLIEDAIAAYDSPQEAAGILSNCFKEYVRYGFDEKSFKRFIRSIDPRVVDKRELAHAFSEWNDSDQDCTEENVGTCAENDALCDGDCYKHFTPIQKEKIIAEQRKNPSRMNKMRIYAILQEDQTTDQDRLRRELAPNAGSNPFAWNKMPRIPLGGEPGYKIKRKRP